MKNRNILAVVLVSGGMDSCVSAAVARKECELAFLHVNYGQRTEERELRAFHDIADYYGVEMRLVTELSHLKDIGGSSLTDIQMSIETGKKLGQDTIPSTYVPFRNAQLLSMAVSWAEVIGARRIYIGAVEEDSSGYPDCRKVFYEAFNKVIELGTRPETVIEVLTPLIGMKKSEIVTLGLELRAPFHLTWSCYEREDIACGECESCLIRMRGFKEAGVSDPLPYRS
ncbi:MAG: 7-cyano-7-deazaguanine synthase QueC [Candidatus Glassbacteria bacterium]